MFLFTLRHNKSAYYTDFAAYTTVVVLMAAWLLQQPGGQALRLTATVVAGLAGWSLAEYLLHRFVLHGLAPFKQWHAAHHQHPSALICTPLLLSGSLIALLVALPAWWLLDSAAACALTLGFVAGYLGYSATHHAIHHWRSRGAWLRERKSAHALHHHAAQSCWFGVTSSGWDRAFQSIGALPDSLRIRTAVSRKGAARIRRESGQRARWGGS